MNCIVTAGPTYEPLDNVRRLTNFSTGRLGTELANHLAAHGHTVTLLLGEQATHRGELRGPEVQPFTTTANLLEQFRTLAAQPVHAIFHAAAVSDFSFGRTWSRTPDGQTTEIYSGKLSTRTGTLLAELVPTPKIIAQLREIYPTAKIVGWKFEVDGTRADVLQLAERQIADCRTNASVANGPAYGSGYSIVTAPGKSSHYADTAALLVALEKFIQP